jgi:hypothetical protein
MKPSIAATAFAAAVSLSPIAHAQGTPAPAPAPATPAANPAQADVDKAMPTIKKIAADPAVVKAIKAQNAKKMSMADIKALDEKWIASKGIPDFVKPYLENDCAKALASYKGQLALIEAFAMDDQGGLVGSIAKTSDYWQGDEDKWSKTYSAGAGAVFVDKPKFDESSQTYSVQVSVPVLEGGKPIGALTVAVAASAGKK